MLSGIEDTCNKNIYVRVNDYLELLNTLKFECSLFRLLMKMSVFVCRVEIAYLRVNGKVNGSVITDPSFSTTRYFE